MIHACIETLTRTHSHTHQVMCRSHIRQFAAIDDRERIACSGVKWHFDNMIWTVVIVACLDYISNDERKREKKAKSAKLDDCRATYIMLQRSVSHSPNHSLIHAHSLTHSHSFRSTDDEKLLAFAQLMCVSAVVFFREGTPLMEVNVPEQRDFQRRVSKFVCENELKRLGDKWLAVPKWKRRHEDLPTPPPQPPPISPKRKRADMRAESRKKV